MFTNGIKNLTIPTVLTVILFILAATIYAQPAKNRGVVNKPKPTPAQTLVLQSPPSTPKKKTIVVLDFNDVSLTADSVKRPIGKQLAVLLTSEFAKQGGFTVISQRDKEIAEERVNSRKLGKDGSYAAQIGKQLSANLVVFGDIIEYTITTENSGILSIKKKAKHDAKVGFTLTLVDVSTNEVKGGVTIEQVISSTDTDWGYVSNSKELTEEQRISMLTAASKAGVVKAVDKLGELLSGKSTVVAVHPNIEPAAAPVSSPQNTPTPANPNNTAQPTVKPATSEGTGKKRKGGLFGTGIFSGNNSDPQKNNKPSTSSNVSSSAGASNTPRIGAIDGADIFVRNLPAGTKVGTKLTVYRIGKVTKDKSTGEILKQEEITVAELEIVSVTPTAFICKIISGSGLTETDLIKIAQ